MSSVDSFGLNCIVLSLQRNQKTRYIYNLGDPPPLREMYRLSSFERQSPLHRSLQKPTPIHSPQSTNPNPLAQSLYPPKPLLRLSLMTVPSIVSPLLNFALQHERVSLHSTGGLLT